MLFLFLFALAFEGKRHPAFDRAHSPKAGDHQRSAPQPQPIMSPNRLW
jgi:hypothetical protein